MGQSEEAARRGHVGFQAFATIRDLVQAYDANKIRLVQILPGGRRMSLKSCNSGRRELGSRN